MIWAFLRVLLLVLLASPSYIYAQQNYTVPGTWRKPTLDLNSMNSIAPVAAAALDQAKNTVNTSTGFFSDSGFGYGDTGLYYAQLALYDKFTNQTRYKSFISDMMKTYRQNLKIAGPSDPNPFVGLNYVMQWGIGAIRSYQAYGDDSHLSIAQDLWNFGYTYTLHASDLAKGTVGYKTFTIPAQCNSLSMAGGTFWRADDPNDPLLNAIGTGSYLTLSAILYEATGKKNETYKQEALTSADFVSFHLMNSQNQAQDGLSANSSESCKPNQGTGPYNSGFLLEGMAILAAATGNTTIQSRVQSAIIPAVAAPWTNSDGILVGADGKGSPDVMRGLRAAYIASDTHLDARQYIQAYIGVQYNSLIELATTGGSNIYAGAWTGPPSSSYDRINQTTAAQVFVEALGLSAANASSPSASQPQPTNTDTPKKSSNTGAIVGGVVGGIVFLAALALSLWFFMRYRRRQKHQGRAAWEIDTDDSRNNSGFPLVTPMDPPGGPEGYNPYRDAPESSNTTSISYGRTHSASNSVSQSNSGIIQSNNAVTQSSGAVASSNSAGATLDSKRQPPVPPIPRSEKAGLRSRLESGQGEASMANRDQQGVSTAAGEADGQQPLPTEELLRMLNERLQDPQHWDPNANPPEYGTS